MNITLEGALVGALFGAGLGLVVFVIYRALQFSYHRLLRLFKR